MGGETTFLYCCDEFAFNFVPALKGCGTRIQVLREVSEQDRGRNIYPEVMVHSENIAILVCGFPPQPPGERNPANGRNALMLRYSLRAKKRHPEEFQELFQSVKAALVSSGAEEG
jgi:hypothetical protein